MKTPKRTLTVGEKLRAFALLSQCQAELAAELCRLLPDVGRTPAPRAGRRRSGRRTTRRR